MSLVGERGGRERESERQRRQEGKMILLYYTIQCLYLLIIMSYLSIIHTHVHSLYTRVVSVSACLRTHPSSIALRYVQRRILMSDPNWNNGRYYGKTFPRVGMQHARYRHGERERGQEERERERETETETEREREIGDRCIYNIGEAIKINVLNLFLKRSDHHFLGNCCVLVQGSWYYWLSQWPGVG